MDFYTASAVKRPVRLSEATRHFAYESIYHFRYGQDTLRLESVSIDDAAGGSTLTPLERYDAAIRAIAEKSPVRICEQEKISGAATLGGAILHVVPAKADNAYFCGSISHLTVDFETILRIGYQGLSEKIAQARARCSDTERLPFYKSLENTVRSLEIWHQRYLEALNGKEEYEENYRNLCHVPKYGAANFYEAVQSLWFAFAFLRLCGNWPGIGRMDLLLGDYLKKDLETGTLTIDQAREILSHFFIKGCEWITGRPCGSGDAQHYQNIILSGIGPGGKDITNEVTYLVLDIVEELGISDFPITVRLNARSPHRLLRRIAEVMRHGGGVIAVYNEDLILSSLKNYGYPEEEAVHFANDGCWEVQIPGKTLFSYVPFDALLILQNEVLKKYENTAFSSYEELYACFKEKLSAFVEAICCQYKSTFDNTSAPPKEWRRKPQEPCTVVSLFEKDCIERGLSYLEGGTVYTVLSPHIGGVADVANSLYAIRKLVFEEQKISLPDLFALLKNNWEGGEALRQYVRSRYRYYGNDNNEADQIVADILNDFAAACRRQDGSSPVLFPPGVSTFGRQIEWRAHRLATPSGSRVGDILSGNASPTPGTDFAGVTSIIKSYCKPDLKKQVTGAALDIQLLSRSCEGAEGLRALVSLMQGFLKLGGFFMQIDVADAGILREAQQHPENYQSLSVRVSGWNARFATLNKDWQDMVIGRMETE